MGEGIVGRSTTELNLRLEELGKWQKEQQDRLIQNQQEQFNELRKERTKIEEMFKHKKDKIVHNPKIPTQQVVTCNSSPWNKLVFQNSSPAERLERAGQLRALLHQAELQVCASECESNCSSLLDGVHSLPDTSSGSENLNNSRVDESNDDPTHHSSDVETKEATTNDNCNEKSNSTCVDHDFTEVKETSAGDEDDQLQKTSEDVSFTLRLESVEKRNTNEAEELREFEILERAAEEGSFTSTSSVVLRALQSTALQKQPIGLRRALSSINEIVDTNSRKVNAVSATARSLTDSLWRQDDADQFEDECSWHTDDDDGPAPEHLSRPSSCSTTPGSANKAASSQLVGRYFSALKAKHQNSTRQTPNRKKTKEIEQQKVVEDVSSLQMKLIELEKEVQKFRKDHESLIALKKERGAVMQQLERDKRHFEKYKEEEWRRLREYLENEKQKLKRERTLYNTYLKTRPQFDRQERKATVDLKRQLEDLKSKMTTRESKWNQAHSRLQDRINLLVQENASLKKELQTQERKWQTSESNCKIPTQRPSSIPVAVTPSKDSSHAAIGQKENNLQGSTTKKKCPPQESSFMLDPNLSLIDSSAVLIEKIEHKDGSIEKVFANGSSEVTYTNGTRKETSSEGVLVFLFNGDIKHVLPNEKVVYYFSENQTTHTSYPDGLQVFHFANNQLEKHFPDGTKEVTYPDRSLKWIYADGSEESVLTDGTVVRTDVSGDCVIHFVNGQKEIHTQEYKKRTFPDGTTKYLYPDGKQETRYADGRIRIRDKDGQLICDQKSD